MKIAIGNSPDCRRYLIVSDLRFGRCFRECIEGVGEITAVRFCVEFLGAASLFPPFLPIEKYRESDAAALKPKSFKRTPPKPGSPSEEIERKRKKERRPSLVAAAVGVEIASDLAAGELETFRFRLLQFPRFLRKNFASYCGCCFLCN
jgi:hypothetical protein